MQLLTDICCSQAVLLRRDNLKFRRSSSCLQVHATPEVHSFGGSHRDRIRLVQEVGITTQRVGAGKLPIRVRNMLLTCCCFVQKLLEVQTVVGLLLGMRLLR